jgi:signal transduction histidine kinase
VPLLILSLGGDWGTALTAACAALLALVCERTLTVARPEPVADHGVAPVSVPPLADGPDEAARTLLEALAEGVLVVDTRGVVALANPSARKALRKPLQDPEGQLLWDVLVPELASLAQDAWRAVQDRSQTTAAELPHVRYPGIACRDRVYDLTAVEAISARTGCHHGVMFLLVDSTRNFELQRLKDRFLSSVSHELRTPLTNVCAYAEILRTLLPGESAEWPEFVRVIHEESVHLSRLVDAMFDFLQLESGDAVFRSEAFDGAAVVREVVAAQSPTAAARRVELQLVDHGDAPPLVADRTRLRQVVQHLLDNAVKFTPAGGRVRVVLGARDEGWELRLEDSGPGVPPADRCAVFEMFHQLRDHMTEKPSGTGLGLATSRAIVARFGGLIWCEASPLGGAGFVVLLPGAGQPRLASIGAGSGAGGGF